MGENTIVNSVKMYERKPFINKNLIMLKLTLFFLYGGKYKQILNGRDK